MLSSLLWSVVRVCGVAVLCHVLFVCAFWVYSNFVRTDDLRRYKGPQRDTWALVTGGSDGIGLAFARRLAARGFNVLITGRNEGKLGGVCERLKKQFRAVQFDYVVSDAADVSGANIDKVVKAIGKDGRDLGVLVNNVGVHQGGAKPFDRIEVDRIVSSVNINCLYPALLTNALLNASLLKRPHRSLIINLSSVVGCSVSVPQMAVYAATKAFNRSFSLALSSDYLERHVDVVCVSPGLTASNMTRMAPGLHCATADECAEGALNKAGLVDVLPHWRHAAMWVGMAAGDWLPAVCRAWMLCQFVKFVKLPKVE